MSHLHVFCIQFFSAMLLAACHQAVPERQTEQAASELDLNTFAHLYQDTLEALAIISITQFAAAERELSSGNYSFSAAHLHEGIVAFRGETSKFRGNEAMQVNKKIDSLTRLRRRLKHEEKVQKSELHRAIMEALWYQPQVQAIYARGQQNRQINKGE